MAKKQPQPTAAQIAASAEAQEEADRQAEADHPPPRRPP